MMRTSWVKSALLLAVLALLAASCRGSGGGEATEADTGAAVATEADTGAAVATEADTGAEATEADTGAEATEADTGTEAPAGSEAPAGEITTDVGVTEEACPDAVNADNGCIYLAVLSDLTVGPFAPLAVPVTEAQVAFWRVVNEEGGIGGYDVDITEYTRDNEYNPEVHSQRYEEVKNDVLAIAQTLGSPTTAAIIDDIRAEGITAVPASWTSAWAFEDVILEAGTNYCFEAMNSIDYAVANLETPPETVMAIHFPGDYGGDGAAGARIAAEANGLPFEDVETVPGADNQAGAISALVASNPSVVMIYTSPTETGTILGQAAVQGFTGTMIAAGPAWSRGLLDSPAAPAVEAQMLIAGYWREFGFDSPGHQAMRDAIGDVEPNEGYTSGWAWSYAMEAALRAAAEAGDLTRAGLQEAVLSLESVDYEGFLPEGSGNYAAGPEGTVRASVINRPDPEGPTGIANVADLTVGPTAEAYDFTEPCFTSN